MGPGCFYPGNSPEETSAHPQFQLQWGRDVSIPEINQLPYLFTFNSKLQWGRDVSIPEIPVLAFAVQQGIMLQWGRDVSIPEIS